MEEQPKSPAEQLRILQEGNNLVDSVARWPYSGWRLLRGSSGDYPFHVGKHLLAMVWFAYADDSGTHRDSVCSVVAGYIGSPRQWKGMRRDWRQALGDIQEFHATDFFQPERWRSTKSPYHGWSDHRADSFLGSLLSVINQYGIIPIGGAVLTEAFFSYTAEDRVWLTGANLITMARMHEGEPEVIDKLAKHEGSPERPYFIIFPGFLVEALRITSKKEKPRIHFYFDRQKDAEAHAKEAFDRFKERTSMPEKENLATITYAESVDEEGLQAADLYAYVWYRKLMNTMNPRLERARRELSKKKSEIFIADKQYFDRMLAARDQHRAEGIRRGMAEGS